MSGCHLQHHALEEYIEECMHPELCADFGDWLKRDIKTPFTMFSVLFDHIILTCYFRRVNAGVQQCTKSSCYCLLSTVWFIGMDI